MRANRGKLIAVWVPGNHGAGGSTITNAVGICLQHITDKSTLIVNFGSTRNMMEQYMKNDVDIKFSLDHIKSFDKGLKEEHIKAYSEAINKKLDIIAGSKISRSLSKIGAEFEEQFIECALESYELVVTDIEAGINSLSKPFLEYADLILAVMSESKIALEEVFNINNNTLKYIASDKTIVVFNAVHSEKNEGKLLRELNNKLGLPSSYGIPFDIKANRAACYEGRFYSYLKQELDKNKQDGSFPKQISELSHIIAEKIFAAKKENQNNPGIISTLLNRARRWGEVDA